jgi:lipopolysaccharide biosynthesis glycosyltransferase
MVVLKDLSPLFDLDLREDDYGMVKDPVASAFRHRPFANSGLILFSLPAVIANDTLGKVREDFERHPRFEQTLLNRDGQVFFLPPEYNEQKTTRPETAVRHYPGYFRPFPFPHVDAIRPADEEKFRKRYPGVYQDLFSLYETYLSSYSSLDA